VPRAESAVEPIHAAGIAFVITSGRQPRAILIHPLALRTPVAGFNGGLFVKPDMRRHKVSRRLPTGDRAPLAMRE
jgi:hydroxymethylpyrimidine pyrophosphatase-like HAD family hydrolase